MIFTLEKEHTLLREKINNINTTIETKKEWMYFYELNFKIKKIFLLYKIKINYKNFILLILLKVNNKFFKLKNIKLIR